MPESPIAQEDAIHGHHDPSARARLIEAGVEIFGRRGYAATSVREIVERAGVTKPVLYYHFGSKEGLMKAIFAEAARAVTIVVEQAARHEGPAREQVLHLCRSLQELVRSRSSELRVVHAVYYFAPELLPSLDFRVFERTVLGELQRLIQAGIDRGEFRPVPPIHAAVATAAVLSTFLDQEMMPPEVRRPDVDLFSVLELIFDGLRPAV